MTSSEADEGNEWPITPDILGIETATICNDVSKEQEITFHTRPLTRLSPKFAQFCRRKKQADGRFTLTCAQNKYDAFTCIALYAYHGKVPTAPKDIDPVYTQRLRWIYYVAEEFALHDLMNKVIDALRVYEFKHKQEIHFYAEEIYRNTSKGSLLRWYSAASAAWSWGRETGPATASQRDNRKKFISAGRGNPDIFADFHLVDLFHRDHIRGFDTDWRDVHDSGLPVCAFHCHAPGETCHRTGITEPAEVPEHISKSFDGVEDTVLLERSQIMDTPSDQDIRSSARPSTPPESSEAEADTRQVEDSNIRSNVGHDTTFLVAEHENILPSVDQPNGVMNDDQETGNPTTATASKVREVEQSTKASAAVPLASIRNPTRFIPPESKKMDRSHKGTSANLENEAPAGDIYGTSDVDMDREDSESSKRQTKKPTERYGEQLASAWGVPLSSLPLQKTRIVPGTVVTAIKVVDIKRPQVNRIIPDVQESSVCEKEKNQKIKTGTKKRKSIAGEDETNRDSHSAVTKKSKTAHLGTKVTTIVSESHKASGKQPSVVQDSDTESSEDDSSELSTEVSSSDEDEAEDEDEKIIEDWSSDEDSSSWEDQASTSQAEIHQDSESSNSGSESEENEPEQPFIDSGIHSHTSSKATSSSVLLQSQPSFSHLGTSNSRDLPGVAPLRPGYCLIYNYKGRCNKACGLQHLCLKCDLQHSSLHHHQYQPDFRAVNKDPSIETCPNWNAGRCAVRVTNCTLRHICSICNGGHRSIYHEHEDVFPKSEKTVRDRDRTAKESHHFHQEGRLDHRQNQHQHQNQSHPNTPHISNPLANTWPENPHSPSHRQRSINPNEETSTRGPNPLEFPFTSCQMWQRGTCIRKRTRCQLAHVCERCGQLTHRTAKHDTYMSKTAPKG
ncbi:1bf5eb9e-3d7c-4c57-9865-9a1072bf0979 [Sclerotinia trifoliorum]|uniref:1bf5eb9e-3d7c-4c57-9865-9a1072bf0979 n=1 Tax=Sclerotinia trifoliorum TaxID=28548 RepID=A0A8H2ZWL7_9HELO|nr:1bf5eb9e-3d7c-4c57-9865-9a1072bf0979 [Sclerotinia trifoliorum]